jgi:CBS domain-containing protein
MNTEKPIREIMTEEVITVKARTPVGDIEELLNKKGFHHLPVVSKGGKLVGIISKEDLRKVHKLTPASGEHPYGWENELYAKDIMTSTPVSIDADDSVGLAADIFLVNKFHALPIVEGDTLVGIVTTHDLLEFAFKS